jgi:hypothetical protein
VGFVVDNMALGQVSPSILVSLPICIPLIAPQQQQ